MNIWKLIVLSKRKSTLLLTYTEASPNSRGYFFHSLSSWYYQVILWSFREMLSSQVLHCNTQFNIYSSFEDYKILNSNIIVFILLENFFSEFFKIWKTWYWILKNSLFSERIISKFMAGHPSTPPNLGETWEWGRKYRFSYHDYFRTRHNTWLITRFMIWLSEFRHLLWKTWG